MWISFKLRDGRIGVCHESDIKSAAADPGFTFAKVQFRDGVEDEIVDAASHDTLGDALAVMFAAMKPRSCRICGCTDDDCSQCVEKTGMPCSWVEDDLCSACHVEPPVKALADDCPRCNIPWVTCPCDSTPDQQRGTDPASVAILGDPREPDGFPAPTGDAMRDLARIEAHMKDQTGINDAVKGDLSPLQDGNHQQIQERRARMGQGGDAMRGARELLNKKRVE